MKKILFFICLFILLTAAKLNSPEIEKTLDIISLEIVWYFIKDTLIPIFVVVALCILIAKNIHISWRDKKKNRVYTISKDDLSYEVWLKTQVRTIYELKEQCYKEQREVINEFLYNKYANKIEMLNKDIDIYRAYVHIYKSCNKFMIDSFKQNHLSEKITEPSIKLYTDRKIELLYNTMKSSTMDFAEDYFRTEMENELRKCIDIAKEYQKKIDEIESQFKDHEIKF
jgi:hypothetical protein